MKGAKLCFFSGVLHLSLELKLSTGYGHDRQISSPPPRVFSWARLELQSNWNSRGRMPMYYYLPGGVRAQRHETNNCRWRVLDQMMPCILGSSYDISTRGLAAYVRPRVVTPAANLQAKSDTASTVTGDNRTVRVGDVSWNEVRDVGQLRSIRDWVWKRCLPAMPHLAATLTGHRGSSE